MAPRRRCRRPVMYSRKNFSNKVAHLSWYRDAGRRRRKSCATVWFGIHSTRAELMARIFIFFLSPRRICTWRSWASRPRGETIRLFCAPANKGGRWESRISRCHYVNNHAKWVALFLYLTHLFRRVTLRWNELFVVLCAPSFNWYSGELKLLMKFCLCSAAALLDGVICSADLPRNSITRRWNWIVSIGSHLNNIITKIWVAVKCLALVTQFQHICYSRIL